MRAFLQRYERLVESSTQALAGAALRAHPRRARLRPGRADAPRRAAPLREPPQARTPRALVRGAPRARHRGLHPVRRRAGRGRRARARRRLGGGGRRRGAAAHDPRRQGPRVQGRRRRGRRPRAVAHGRDPLPLRRPLRVQGRPPGTGTRVEHDLVPGRQGDAGARRGGRAAAPLLRRDDARDGPADRLRLGRPLERARRARRRSAGCSGGSGCGRSSTAPRPPAPVEVERGRAARRAADRPLCSRPPGARRGRRPPLGPEPRRASSCSSRAQGRRSRRRAAAARARRDPRAAARSRRAALLQRHLAVRPLRLPLLRRAHRRHAAGAVGARGERATARSRAGLHPTEIGDAVHRLLELVDLGRPRRPCRPSSRSSSAAWYPTVVGGGARRGSSELVAAYTRLGARRRIAGLHGVRPERPFAFELDGRARQRPARRALARGRAGARARLQDERARSAAIRRRSSRRST